MRAYLAEANERAFYATLHSYDDGTGVGGGYGAARSDWNTTLYGRDGRCIDTRFPFAVAAHFPTNASGDLVAMEVLRCNGRAALRGLCD